MLDEANGSGEQQLGLSFRNYMCSRCGMIFVFPAEDRYAFWMKDMRFNLDMIYLSRDKKVVEIFENFRKETYPNVYENSAGAQYVIELNSGTVNRYGIKIGDVLDY